MHRDVNIFFCGTERRCPQQHLTPHPVRHRRGGFPRTPRPVVGATAMPAGARPPAGAASCGDADRGDVVGATSAPRPLPALSASGWGGLAARRRSPGRHADIVFLALPEAASAEIGATLLQRDRRVIDSLGAFRIRSDADRQAGNRPTTALPQSGLRPAGAACRRHSPGPSSSRCPGCYPTSRAARARAACRSRPARGQRRR